MARERAKREGGDDIRDVCRNRRAFHDYEVMDRLECGMVLTGTEVKSLRAGHASIEEGYGRVDGNELWLIGCDIPEYAMGNQMNHLPRRPRKLLAHRREIAKFAGRATDKGLTLIPLRLYFKNGKAKLELAVCKGKQHHDKRESLKKADADREIKREMARRRKE
ncbi:MAG: SsrA-binding protein SmpB [Gemmataceae bacterium]|nr:SsrA-binding protein SmpB [Gemmataceae bacterium]